MRSFIFDPGHNTVRAFKIGNGRALAQKFRIGGNGKIYTRFKIRPGQANGFFNFSARAHGDSGFGNNQCVIFKARGNFFGGRKNIRQVCKTITAPRGRANCNKHRIRIRHGIGKIGGKRQATGFDIFSHQIFQARLINWNFSLVEAGDFILILVNANHFMAEIGKTSPRYKTHIACSDHCYFHGKNTLGREIYVRAGPPRLHGPRA